MTPQRFIRHWERVLERPLSVRERAAVDAARLDCATGKRDSVKAMGAALQQALAASS
jgi:hypothetical protein